MNLNQKLQQRIELAKRKRREADKAEGALSEVKRQIKEELGCTSVEEVKKLLIAKQKKLTSKEEAAAKVEEAFTKKHHKVLEQLDED